MNGTVFSTLFGGFASRKKRREHAHFLYGMVVASARNPVLFRRFDIPDTFDGRFEMLTTHLYVLNCRLRDAGEAGRALSQEVFDLFIADMDAALRELGVGDQVVPKRLAKMTRVVHGRVAAYDQARVGSTEVVSALAAVVSRNVFDGRDPETAEFAMAGWIRDQIEALHDLSLEEMLTMQDLFAPKVPAEGTM